MGECVKEWAGAKKEAEAKRHGECQRKTANRVTLGRDAKGRITSASKHKMLETAFQ